MNLKDSNEHEETEEKVSYKEQFNNDNILGRQINLVYDHVTEYLQGDICGFCCHITKKPIRHMASIH